MIGSDAMSAGAAVVTGGSGGIGRACAVRLAHDGFAVIVHFGAGGDAADGVVADIRRTGGMALAVQADVADERAMAHVFDRAESEFGGGDVVVHTAAQNIPSRLVDLDLNVLDSMHRTNIRGTFVVDQQAVRRVRPGGTIINFSSSVLGTARPGFATYAASKGAVEAVTLILADELTGRNVTVNTVAPGQTVTDTFVSLHSQADIESFSAAIPLGRLAEPGDIAPTW